MKHLQCTQTANVCCYLTLMILRRCEVASFFVNIIPLTPWPLANDQTRICFHILSRKARVRSLFHKKKNPDGNGFSLLFLKLKSNFLVDSLHFGHLFEHKENDFSTFKLSGLNKLISCLSVLSVSLSSLENRASHVHPLFLEQKHTVCQTNRLWLC